MCGVCAGNPSEVVLGDVIIAEMTYFYDEGKRTATGFEGDLRQSSTLEDWLRAAQDLDISDLAIYGEASDEEAKIWLLERIYMGDDPRTHFARQRYFPHRLWAQRVKQCEAEGLIVRNGLKLELTSSGISYIEEVKFFSVETPNKLPFKLKVGPIASGNVVVKDGVTWEHLKKLGVRTVAGLEMEAALIGATAKQLNIPSWIVAKGVMDYADPKKDDRFKPFAARASAEVLFKFIDKFAAPSLYAYFEERKHFFEAASMRLEDIASEVELAADQLIEFARYDIQSLGDLASVASSFPTFFNSIAKGSVFAEHVENRLGDALKKLVSTAHNTIVRNSRITAPTKDVPWREEQQANDGRPSSDSLSEKTLISIDLRIPSWPIRDQGVHPLSVAIACAAAVEHARYTVSRCRTDFSARFLHWMMKRRDGDDREGTTLESARDVLMREGICEETAWPYHLLAEPSPRARRQALHHRFLPNYMRPNGNNAQLVLDALRRGKVVVVSVPVFVDPSFSNTSNNWSTGVGWAFGIVLNPPPTSIVAGGHAVCIVGFMPDSSERSGGYFILRNCWGSDWAKESPAPGNSYSFEPGYGQISASYINEFMWEVLYL